MNHWAFVIAAYCFTVAALAALLLISFAAMRRAESGADKPPER